MCQSVSPLGTGIADAASTRAIVKKELLNCDLQWLDPILALYGILQVANYIKDSSFNTF